MIRQTASFAGAKLHRGICAKSAAFPCPHWKNATRESANKMLAQKKWQGGQRKSLAPKKLRRQQQFL
jgi:hypothetical protein